LNNKDLTGFKNLSGLCCLLGKIGFMISLRTIFSEFPFPFSPADFPDLPVTGLAIDNRKVEPGNLFVAMQGGSADGHDFIPDAIRRGAVAVVGQQEISGLVVPYIRVDNSRQALTHVAVAFYGYPGRKLTVIGVTGTDGKTTTSNLIYQILVAAGLKAGMISTVNAVIGDEVLDTGFHVTTPDAPDVQLYLSKMVAAGLTHVVLETTSHGLAQYRVDASLYDIAVVTNITHEHLNDHGSLENYRAAKARLFQLLAETPEKTGKSIRLAVLNRDDWSFDYLGNVIRQVNAQNPPERQISQVTYGLGGTAETHAENIAYLPSGIEFDAVGAGFSVRVKSPLVGAYNVSNCLAALTATVKGLGIDPQTAARGIAALAGIPGRMERIDLGQNFTVIVDFAHTPNALKVTLETARQMLNPPLPVGEGLGVRASRVIVAFGSAGLRDKEKRRMMAEISAQLADLTVLTAEDPRTESLDGILAEMAVAACSKGGVEGETFWRIPDRGEAIRFMLKRAQPGDILLSCGKGHEQSMCFGTTEYLWDDRTAMKAALAEFLGVNGPQMPYLPTQSDKNSA
jgi:UDP-N-acetylmuramoyl-L-alanyl-D-glutamate--2,6-diaminopimelate ligase